MVGDTLVSGFLPSIVFAVILEPSLQRTLVGGGFLPDLTTTDFVEQQTVVILLEEIFHLGIGGSQGVRTILEDCLLGQRAL